MKKEKERVTYKTPKKMMNLGTEINTEKKEKKVIVLKN